MAANEQKCPCLFNDSLGSLGSQGLKNCVPELQIFGSTTTAPVNGLLWFDMVSKAKSKKKLEFLFFAYVLPTISQKKLRSFLFVCFCCYGLICYAVFDSKSTRHIA